MKQINFVTVLALALSFTAATASAKSPRKILFFSKSSGFEHSAIKVTGTNLSAAEQVLKELGEKNNFEFTFTKDGTVFTPKNIKKYDAFFFYTTGDLTEVGTDGNPAMSPEGKAAFLEAIKKGKGFIGTHSATDTFHSPGGKLISDPARYQDDDDKADPYIKMIGAEFIKHGSQQAAHQIVADKKFPGLSAVPDGFGPLEEWYALKDFATNLHVLLVQDTSRMKNTGADKVYDRPPYPSTFAHMYGKGRVFYTNMGHREDVWTNPVFQSVLIGGINWAVGNVKADVTPNMTTSAPEGRVLPKE